MTLPLLIQNQLISVIWDYYIDLVRELVSNARTAVLYHWVRKNFISRSCPILVLTTVLLSPRHPDAKNGAKNYQGQTTSREHTFFQFLVCL
jgi:hypothetical protein